MSISKSLWGLVPISSMWKQDGGHGASSPAVLQEHPNKYDSWCGCWISFTALRKPWEWPQWLLLGKQTENAEGEGQSCPPSGLQSQLAPLCSAWRRRKRTEFSALTCWTRCTAMKSVLSRAPSCCQASISVQSNGGHWSCVRPDGG